MSDANESRAASQDSNEAEEAQEVVSGRLRELKIDEQILKNKLLDAELKQTEKPWWKRAASWGGIASVIAAGGWLAGFLPGHVAQVEKEKQLVEQEMKINEREVRLLEIQKTKIANQLKSAQAELLTLEKHRVDVQQQIDDAYVVAMHEVANADYLLRHVTEGGLVQNAEEAKKVGRVLRTNLSILRTNFSAFPVTPEAKKRADQWSPTPTKKASTNR